MYIYLWVCDNFIYYNMLPLYPCERACERAYKRMIARGLHTRRCITLGFKTQLWAEYIVCCASAFASWFYGVFETYVCVQMRISCRIMLCMVEEQTTVCFSLKAFSIVLHVFGARSYNKRHQVTSRIYLVGFGVFTAVYINFSCCYN